MAQFPPQRLHRTGDLPGAEIGGIEGEVDGEGGAVILAHPVDLLRRAAADVLRHGLLGEGAQAHPLLVELLAHVIFEIGADQPFGIVIGLGEEEPVIGFPDPAERQFGQRRVGRHDIDERQLDDLVGMIQRQAVADPGAAVVTGEEEGIEAELGHDLDLVIGHGAEGIGGVVGAAIGLGAVAVTPEIGRHHGEVAGKIGRDLVPHDVVEGIAVKQQERRPGAAMDQVDGRPLGLDLGLGEAFEHKSSLRSAVYFWSRHRARRPRLAAFYCKRPIAGSPIAGGRPPGSDRARHRQG